jgi:enterochelin esterase-like enzyme
MPSDTLTATPESVSGDSLRNKVHPGLALLLCLSLVACNSSPQALASATPSISALGNPSGTAPPTEISPSPQPPTATTTATLTTQPSKTSSPTPLTCWQDGGRLETSVLDTDLLRQPLDYSVYLPPCYDQQTTRRYPVLYLIHGQSYTDDQWLRLGAGATADRLSAAGEIPPLIIVMPRDRIWEQPTVDKFGDVVVDQLIPFIDQTYRTLPDRQHRAVGGLSRGAGWAVHLGLSHWELFGAFGAHSLPVFWTDTSHIPGWLDAIPPESLPRIYLDIGDKDRPPILNSAVWFETLLTRKHIPHEWYLFNGYHEEAYWSAHVEQYLRWYTQGW